MFWYNAFVILSNGSKARIGSMTAGFEHFAEWKKIDDEKESGLISLDTMIRGVCEKRKLLDFVENFTLFDERKGELTKLVAKNHQFLGVNNAIAAVEHIKDNQGKLGVFWHTQGSGKSYSMVFFSQKVLRKIPGNWTFVIVTDREDLDGQIYRNFANTGAVLEDEKRVRADSGESLKRMLNQEDHRYVFTLIQKFHTEHGEQYPVLSTRSDIIVITDEAHRSQYDIFASNMRSALPNAAFIGFTGTPLMAGEERTKEVFGEYVSIYNFKESVDDQNTVPLYYENRIPELQLTNDNLTEDIAEICERADLDDDQERKLEREFAREYHLITRDDRLDRIGEDIVAHFMGRGVLAKAMVISIDKATAVRTFDKVQKHWKIAIAKLRKERCRRRSDGQAGTRRAAEVLRGNRHGRGGLAVTERDRRVQEEGPGHRHAPQADGEGRPGNEVQEPRRSAPHRVRVRHVDHRFRRAVVLHDLPGQADEEPHAHADHRTSEPGVAGQAERPDRGLRGRFPQSCKRRWRSTEPHREEQPGDHANSQQGANWCANFGRRFPPRPLSAWSATSIRRRFGTPEASSGRS